MRTCVVYGSLCSEIGFIITNSGRVWAPPSRYRPVAARAPAGCVVCSPVCGFTGALMLCFSASAYGMRY
ncbi:hypothetical protein GGR51DRAFT_541868 [Nemania sp. FL0031]|nr:hypothetical protein GGR51DRAFT_541868 [Nemania sp. FL0031]